MRFIHLIGLKEVSLTLFDLNPSRLSLRDNLEVSLEFSPNGIHDDGRDQ